jgi:hypothetical protein
MIKAVESAASRTAGDTVETSANTTVHITTNMATPSGTVSRVAAYFALLIVIPGDGPHACLSS